MHNDYLLLHKSTGYAGIVTVIKIQRTIPGTWSTACCSYCVTYKIPFRSLAIVQNLLRKLFCCLSFSFFLIFFFLFRGPFLFFSCFESTRVPVARLPFAILAKHFKIVPPNNCEYSKVKINLNPVFNIDMEQAPHKQYLRDLLRSDVKQHQ